ncbi:hypothetical protein KZX46_10555 [Polymorphobacter sp. PAMC 29334]|uniref:hypothetical protein n=1 Tax=Polymorphobacter sp. PAMC 29334 TaxID=2862331 RepID=UPI001C7546DC|nr:hypothetical protein [Polymorphobacter sp. PAMC 29334]QYE36323.1 hypothetical protein KZX46_10555 [Polymorphobacter sp. PAMC 29334]
MDSSFLTRLSRSALRGPLWIISLIALVWTGVVLSLSLRTGDLFQYTLDHTPMIAFFLALVFATVGISLPRWLQKIRAASSCLFGGRVAVWSPAMLRLTTDRLKRRAFAWYTVKIALLISSVMLMLIWGFECLADSTFAKPTLSAFAFTVVGYLCVDMAAAIAQGIHGILSAK